MKETTKNVNGVKETKVSNEETKVSNNTTYVVWKGMIMSYQRYVEEREAEKD